MSATCEESEIPAVTQASAALKNVLYVPDQPGKNRSMPSYPLAKKNEGFMDASQVQYVARAGNYAAHGFSYHGAHLKSNFRIRLPVDQCPRQGRRLWLHERIYEERRYVFCVLPGSESLCNE